MGGNNNEIGKCKKVICCNSTYTKRVWDFPLPFSSCCEGWNALSLIASYLPGPGFYAGKDSTL